MPLGASFFEDVPSVEFIYLIFTPTPSGVTVGDSGLCCCVLCLSSAIIPLCLLMYFYRGVACKYFGTYGTRIRVVHVVESLAGQC